MYDKISLAELLLDQVDEHAFTFLDVGGHFIEWSSGAEKIYGYTREEVLGQSAAIIFTPEDAERGIFIHELAVAQSGGSMEDDRWMMRKDGQRIWVTGVLKALRDKNDELIGFAKVMRNRTDLKIRSETVETQLNSLRLKEKQNQNAIAVSAHELRNTVAPISNAAMVLEIELSTDPRFGPMLEILGRQSKILVKLAEDLLDATRSVHGKIHCEKVPVELIGLLHNVAESIRPLSLAKQQIFTCTFPPTEIMVGGDPIRLQQVFTNLLNNAIKYTPPHGQIFLRATSDGDAFVTIEDTGVGIAPEMLPKIFELFTQEPEQDKTHSGLGIGLAIVKELITLHGGTVQAKSDGKNRGSFFTVQLPLLK